MDSLTDILQDWARTTPEQPLYTFRNVHGQITDSYTCAAFNARVNHVAQRLHDRKAVRAGEPVLLVYPPGLEGIVAFMACVKNGAIPVPAPWPDRISGRVAKERIQHMQADCEARFALTVGDGLHRLNGHANGASRALEWIPTESWCGTQDHCRTSHCDTLFLQYTSGSTDLPRGVIVSHENVIHNHSILLDGQCRGVSWLPFHHDMGLIGFYLFTIVTGGVSHLIAPADFLKRPRLWFDTMTAARADITCAPNFGYEYCLRKNKISDEELSDFDLSCMQLMMNGAEPVDPVTMDSFAKRFRVCGLNSDSLVAIYGLAEHTLAVTRGGRRFFDLSTCPAAAAPAKNGSQTRNRIVSCGQPLPGVEVCIVDPARHSQTPEGGVGEIWLRGKSVTKGYWGHSHQEGNSLFQATLDSETNGKTFLRTGDLGFLRDGELYITGRLKEVIQVRGRNIYPVDVESIVLRNLNRSGRGSVAAFGSTANRATEEIAVLVESWGQEVNLRKVVQAIGEHLGVRPAVAALVTRGTLSMTSSGKLARNECRRRWESGEIEPLQQLKAPEPAMGDRGGFSAVMDQIEGLPDDETVEFAGLDSLTLTELQLELLRGAQGKSIDLEEYQYDMRLINKLTLGELRALLRKLKDPSFDVDEIEFIRNIARTRIGEIASNEHRKMLEDGELSDDIQPDQAMSQAGETGDILLTGATGFVGSFLLDSLLRTTERSVVVLVRASNATAGRERIAAALQKAKIGSGNGRDLADQIVRRVRVICGDLSRQRIGVTEAEWDNLSATVGAVYHCGAEVDYVKSYDALNFANVRGCEEVIRLCATGMLKQLHLISTTFVAGWTSMSVLPEAECEPPDDALNFGYAQSKWVAERLAYQALRRGLPVKVFRPSLLTASTTGSFVQEDIVSRVFSYLVRYGLRPTCLNQLSMIPADVAAQNIVAVSLSNEASADTYHVTAGSYYNMGDICDCISQCFGYAMEACSLDSTLR